MIKKSICEKIENLFDENYFEPPDSEMTYGNDDLGEDVINAYTKKELIEELKTAMPKFLLNIVNLFPPNAVGIIYLSYMECVLANFKKEG